MDKVTEEYMEERIADVQYFVMPGTTVTICNITLDNGFSVRGESACVSAENFNVERGQAVSYQKAFNALWPFFGFALAEKKHRRERLAVED